MAPDPTFAFVGGPWCPTLDFVIAFWIMIYVSHIVNFAILYFKGRSLMTFIVSAMVKNGVPKGQIFKSKELYSVVPHIKGLDEHF
jgi:hypothetical protein